MLQCDNLGGLYMTTSDSSVLSGPTAPKILEGDEDIGLGIAIQAGQYIDPKEDMKILD